MIDTKTVRALAGEMENDANVDEGARGVFLQFAELERAAFEQAPEAMVDLTMQMAAEALHAALDRGDSGRKALACVFGALTMMGMAAPAGVIQSAS